MIEDGLTTGRSPERAVRFTVPGEPRSKQRPRVTKRGVYTPPQTMEQEAKIRDAFMATGAARIGHTIAVEIDFYNGKRYRRDIDNMAKLVLDALNGLAYEDDYLIVDLSVRKFQTSAERARTEIAIIETILWPDET